MSRCPLQPLNKAGNNWLINSTSGLTSPTPSANDGKHVACKAPPDSGSEYYNYKGFYSIILIGVVSSDYNFIWEDVSGKGSLSDVHIYNNGELKAGLVTFWAPPPPP